MRNTGANAATKPVLAVMAAGIGSRYGGLKQIDPVGKNGELIIDYSVYDAVRAGFAKVVFIISKRIEQSFRDSIGQRLEKIVDTEYVFQNLDDIPVGFNVPDGRVKPWGTAHAVLSCRDVIKSPFAVINADDFYGPSSYKLLYRFLEHADGSINSGACEFCLAGYRLNNTLTDHGHVARGICDVDASGYLSSIKERTRIMKVGGIVKYTENGSDWVEIPENSIVSLNTWGFTPAIFDELLSRFSVFLDINKNDLQRAEFFLPDVIGQLLQEKKASVKVLLSGEKWYGVTYKEDRPLIVQALEDMTLRGIYPMKLWDNP